ncbi:MAG: DUF4912 domain-containing protein [Blastocatellia bacterium]
MAEKKIAKTGAKIKVTDEDVVEFVLDEFLPVSSGEMIQAEFAEARTSVPETVIEDDEAELSPVFKELRAPKLPELTRENRARLQMQSPNRLFFYWSVNPNPFQTLNRALGNETGSYTLALKLIDLKRDREELHAVDTEGSWWFSVDADSKYRAEIGFFAPNRPYVRILYSNTVETPRKSPSPRAATSADWTVSSNKFAKVLDVAGFSQDAFEVAMAGDDAVCADAATYSAYAKLFGRDAIGFETIDAEELRYALLAIAAGATLESLRWRVSASLFSLLQQNIGAITAANAMNVLRDEFGVEADEIVEEESGATVFGASLVNVPRVLRTWRTLPKFESVSSHSYR